VSPGYTSVKTDWAGDTGASDLEVNFEAAQNHTYYIRHYAKFGFPRFPTTFDLVPAEYALYELKELREIGILKDSR
jgi:hypothetical protein